MNNASLIGVGYTQSLRPGNVFFGTTHSHFSCSPAAYAVILFFCVPVLSKCEPSFSSSTGVKLTLSALVDGKNFNSGGHKVGMGFELEA